MRAQSVLALFVTGAWILACTGGGDDAAEEKPAEGGEEKPAEGGAKLEPGKIHVDYPVVETDAAAGQFVLAPSRDALDRAAAEGSGTFIYYGGEMLEPGDAESKVKSLAGSEFMIPNSLIIPIDKGYAASVGDVLLGHWESGSGMYRCCCRS